jgi:hypothetical protein
MKEMKCLRFDTLKIFFHDVKFDPIHTYNGNAK